MGEGEGRHGIIPQVSRPKSYLMNGEWVRGGEPSADGGDGRKSTADSPESSSRCGGCVGGYETLS